MIKELRGAFGRAVQLEPMLHQRPLSPRFWAYCVAAYLMPVVTQLLMPADPGMYDELVWLVTLAPAFLLALHYGLNGALVSMLLGTALFIAVQISLAFNFTPDDWRITVPIFIAYGTLSISVGWLSQELHDHYRRLLESERIVGAEQVSVTLRHELNNALQQVLAESQLLLEDRGQLTDVQRRSLASIGNAARQMARDVEKLTRLASAPTIEYVGGVSMLDLRGAAVRTTVGPNGGDVS